MVVCVCVAGREAAVVLPSLYILGEEAKYPLSPVQRPDTPNNYPPPRVALLDTTVYSYILGHQTKWH